MYRLTLAVAGIAAVVQGFCVTPPAGAVVIATDDFQSYSLGAIVDQGTAGSGWGGAWTGGDSSSTLEVPVRDVSAGVMPGFGQSLELGFSAIRDGRQPANNNIAQRTFDPQTDTVYIGFAVKSVGFDNGGTPYPGDLFQMYVNNTESTDKTGSYTDSLSCGFDFSPYDPDDPGADGAYIVRKGHGAGESITSFLHTNNVVHRMVMKVSKSDPMFGGYDQAAIWIDRESEIAPDAVRTADDEVDPTFSTISVFHVRVWGYELDDRVFIDDLKIATTYAEALPTLPPVPTIPGDTDGNMIVDAADAQVLALNWGSNVGTGGFASGDFNDDQVVNAADASIQAANWGNHMAEAAGVPEPGAIVMMTCLALAAVVRPRR